MKIGFIGLGRMGESMARNLLSAGHELTVYNRTREKAEALGREGAQVADSPARAAAAAGVLITMLSDDQAVREAVLEGDQAACAGLRRDAVHISSSTISTGLSKELEARHRERGQAYIAAPVFGRPEAAAAKKLRFLAAGDPRWIESCRPALEAMGSGISIVGEQPWQANLIKIAVNFVLASTIETIGESCALVEKHGMSSGPLFEALNGTLRSPVIDNYGEIVSARRYDPAGFSLRLGLKDTELALEAARSAALPLPLGGLLRDHCLQAMAYGHGDLDWAVIAEISRVNANVVRTVKAGG